jgi:hypothetical protein
MKKRRLKDSKKQKKLKGKQNTKQAKQIDSIGF